MTLVGRWEGVSADYLDVAEARTEHGARPRADLHERFRRIALSTVINNVDDHLRNHGFLRRGSGRELAPVFDVNPHPDPGVARGTSIAGATRRDEASQALIGTADWST